MSRHFKILANFAGTLLTACLYLTAESFSDIQKDIAYRGANSQNTLDLYYPTGGEKPYPTHIYIHGGGWTGGSKNIGGLGKELFEKLADNGFLGVSVEYRKVKADQKIYMRESTVDTLDAIRYVVAHAEELGVDTNNVFLWGSSAGGHLTLMGATAINNPALSESPELAKIQVHIKGAMAWFPPCDMVNYEKISIEKNGKLRLLSNRMGRTLEENPEAYQEISPLDNLTASCPPVLIFHGDKDRTVNAEHSYRFKQKADQMNIDCTLQIVENAGHGFKRNAQPPLSPDVDFILSECTRFFTERTQPSN